MYIQSFEVANLRNLSTMTDLRLLQLINCSGWPYDFSVAGDPRTYADLVTRSGLRDVARYASGIGVCKDVLIPRTASAALGAPSAVIAEAHRRAGSARLDLQRLVGAAGLASAVGSGLWAAGRCTVGPSPYRPNRG